MRSQTSAMQKVGISSSMPDGLTLDQLSTIAEAFINDKVDVIVTIGATAVRAAKETTTQIPIAFAGVVDPVATGLVRNLSKPDGNVTGASTFDPEQARQQVELRRMPASDVFVDRRFTTSSTATAEPSPVTSWYDKFRLAVAARTVTAPILTSPRDQVIEAEHPDCRRRRRRSRARSSAKYLSVQRVKQTL